MSAACPHGRVSCDGPHSQGLTCARCAPDRHRQFHAASIPGGVTVVIYGDFNMFDLDAASRRAVRDLLSAMDSIDAATAAPVPPSKPDGQ